MSTQPEPRTPETRGMSNDDHALYLAACRERDEAQALIERVILLIDTGHEVQAQSELEAYIEAVSP